MRIFNCRTENSKTPAPFNPGPGRCDIWGGISGYYARNNTAAGIFHTPVARRIYNLAKLSRNTFTYVSNGLYEPNESFSSLTERKILTIDPIDFDVRHADGQTDDWVDGRTKREKERGRGMCRKRDVGVCVRCTALLSHIASFTFA